MASLPTGTVTFLFTDIEGATRLLQQLGDRYADSLTQYRHLLRAAVRERGGQEVDTQGDALFFVFPRARDAVAAAVAAQRAIATHTWAEGVAVRVRMGLHTGEPLSAGTGYIGMDVHRVARICAAGHGQQILLSGTTRDLIEHDLPGGLFLRDLGEHRLKDLAHPHRLFQVVAPDLTADFPPLRSLDARPHNLPVQLTSFIGREREIAEVQRLLSGTRLLTLTGAGGSGKTRLALQVAAEVFDEFPDGVWLIELAVVSDPLAAPRAMASVLAVREEHDRHLLDTLAGYLESKRMLLVLDNCEHLVASVAQVSERFLRSAPHLRILATSRESLGVPGEVIYRIPTLAVPPEGEVLAPDRLREYEATRLLGERAQAALPTFHVTPANALVVAEVARRLDGIPLAIEFAAALVKALSIEEIALRLHDQFRLLSSGTRTAVLRHQTLRATLDWSYDLLAETERTVLRQSGAFVGGFSLEAVEKVCARNDLSEAKVLDTLIRLVDKSLVVVDQANGTSRYRLLEPVRQYAHEKMAATGETDAMQRRHRDYFLDLAERAEPELHGPRQLSWLERLETEHGNFRAALQWSLGQPNDTGGLRLAGALWWYWTVRGHLVEGREWLERVLASAGDAPASARLKALTGAGALASAGDDHERAVTLLQDAVTLAQEQRDTQALAVGLALLGHSTWHQGDPQTSVALAEKSHVLSRQLGDVWPMARSSYDLAIVAWHIEDYERMAVVAREWLRRAEANGDLWGRASSLHFLGEYALHRGAYQEAARLFAERQLLAQAMRDPYAVGIAQVRHGHALLALGQVAEAEDIYRQSIEPLRRLGDRWWLAYCLEGLAAVASAKQMLITAATLLGAADALRSLIGRGPSVRPDHARAAAAARGGLGDEQFTQAWERGRAMTRDQAIAYAAGS